MGGQFARLDHQPLEQGIDVAALAVRLDRADVLLLREFYITGRPHPDDTTSHVLCLLAEHLRHGSGPLARLSYGAIRRRVENLVALGLLGRVAHTNPAVYYGLDWAAPPVRKIILRVAADFVGILPARGGGPP